MSGVPYTAIMAEEPGLLADLWHESCKSFAAMPRWSQITLVIGMVVFIAAVLPPLDRLPKIPLATVRTAAFLALVVGLIATARMRDEFFLRVYLHACAIAFILSSTIVFASLAYDIPLGRNTFTVLDLSFLIGFFGAFWWLRRP